VAAESVSVIWQAASRCAISEPVRPSSVSPSASAIARICSPLRTRCVGGSLGYVTLQGLLRKDCDCVTEACHIRFRCVSEACRTKAAKIAHTDQCTFSAVSLC
jgi:hypothetical protein